MRANEYAAVHACIKVGMPWFRMRVCMASHARDGVCAATFRRVRVHVFSTPRDRCITDHRDGRRSVRTVRDGVWGGSSSLRSFAQRSEEHTSELPSLMRISYAVFCLKKKNH